MNRLLVYILLSPRIFYQKMGVNIDQLKSILATKLLMDERRPNSLQQVRQKKSDKPTNSSSIGTIIMAALMGILFLFPLFLSDDLLTQFTLFFILLIFFLSMMLITDFTSVLIDVRDNLIILPKPVNEKTFLLARLLHIIAHVSKIVLPMSIPALIYVGVNMQWYGIIILLLLIFFATILSIFIINMVYLLILKITTPEKFKTAISYIQIVFSIIVYGSYQLLPRLMDQVIGSQFIIPQHAVLLFCPPYWFAGSWLLMYEHHFTLNLFIAFILSITMPIFSIWLVIKYLAPAFTAKLTLITGSVEEGVELVKNKLVKEKEKTLKERLAKILVKGSIQRMGFLQTWNMTSRSRDFKMKVYPSIGYLIVIILITFIRIKPSSIENLMNAIKQNNSFIIISMYFSGIILLISLGQLKISTQWKASWIYFITPISIPGNIINGAVKALIVKFFAVPAILLFAGGFYLGGLMQIPNMLLTITNQLFIAYTIAYITLNKLPFSEDEHTSQQGRNFLNAMFSMLIPMSIGLMHYFIMNNMPLVIIALCLSGISVWLIYGSVNNMGWSKIKAAV